MGEACGEGMDEGNGERVGKLGLGGGRGRGEGGSGE